MTRNGSASPFPNEFMSPPTWSSQTGSGRRGFRLRRYADDTPTASHRDYGALGGERFAPGVRRPVRLAGYEDVDPVVQEEPDRTQRLVVDPGLDLPQEVREVRRVSGEGGNDEARRLAYQLSRASLRQAPGQP